MIVSMARRDGELAVVEYVVEYSNSRRCAPLARTPSGPLTQPLSSSNLLADAGSNIGQEALGSKPGWTAEP